MHKKKRIVVGLSGGVDSAVAAWLLKEEGYEVLGVFMKNWDDQLCPYREDLVDAVAVAELLNIDIEVVDFSKEYQSKVFNNFLEEYKCGRTPNPDILCNAEIKFKVFLEYAMKLGGESIATGHYAQIDEQNNCYRLLQAEDGTKDQSYFLYRLSQKQLAKAVFPLGKIYKRDVRKLAKKIGLPNHDKKDSTGICFIGERSFREFIRHYIPENPGDICTMEGKLVGNHQGLVYYTIGQRQGLGIGGPGEPWYVVKKDVDNNRLVVAQGHNHTELHSDVIFVKHASWISGINPKAHWVFNAKTRYRQNSAPCTIEKLEHESFEIRFAEPQWGVAPGQSVVVYESNECIGGGIIDSSTTLSKII
ncbi:MAG: tRNA 2-thiouridine(34) synthase MnmA [Proteobacteria bacterium]|nr:tRNA 2-thiouridine(34) synthase MnmA [Pseudomonadota bacterium]